MPQCRLLYKVLPQRPPLLVPSQAWDSHCRPVCLRFALWDRHGDQTLPILFCRPLLQHIRPHYMLALFNSGGCNTHFLERLCVCLRRCSGLGRITGACIPTCAALGEHISSPAMWASPSVSTTRGEDSSTPSARDAH